jgi:hypothetical protein
MRPITANQKRIPTLQLTTTTIKVILDILVPLYMVVHTKLQPTAMDLILQALLTHTPQVHHLILMEDILIHMVDTPTHMVDQPIKVEAVIAPALIAPAPPIMEPKN